MLKNAFVLGALAILGVAKVYAAEPVTWSIERINSVLRSGETRTLSLSFKASTALGNIRLRVVPEIAPYITVTPKTVTAVRAGTTIPVTVTVRAGSQVASILKDGTIQVREAVGQNGRVFARPLPVRFMVQVGGIAAPDANNNGIWDYIDQYIAQNITGSPGLILAVQQYVRVFQASLLDANDRDLSLKHAREIDRAIECAYSYDTGDGTDAADILQRLDAAIMNNRERSMAAVVWSEHSAGHYFPGVSGGLERTSCTFTSP